MRSTFNYLVAGVAESIFIDFKAAAATRPGGASGLLATITSRSQADISWKAPIDDGNAAITGYRLNVTNNSTNVSTDYLIPATSLSYTLTGLVLGTTYSLKIISVNTIGESLVADSTTLFFSLPAPAAPTNVTASKLHSTSLILTWNAPPGFVDGYTVQASLTGSTRDYWDVGTTTQTSLEVKDLQPETQYYFKVVAYNVSKVGTAAVAIIKTLDAIPHAPTQLQISDTSATTISLTWAAPDEDVSGYVVEISSDGESWDEVGGPEDITPAFTITDLQPETEYYFRVHAYSDYGDGEASSAVQVTTRSGRPNPVISVQGWSTSETSIHLHWQSPQSAYAPITGFRIESRAVSSVDASMATDWEMVTEVSGEETDVVIDTLTPCVSLDVNDPCPQTQYRVIALTDYGEADSDAFVTVDPAFSLPSSPSKIAVDVIAPGSVALTWQPAAEGTSPISGYSVYYSTSLDDLTCAQTDQNGCFIGVQSFDTADTTAIITDLEPGSTYYFAIVAHAESTAFGDVVGARSDVISADIPADITAVSNVTVETVTENEVSLTWDSMPTWWGRTNYLIQLSADSGETWTDVAATSQTSATVSGLAGGTHYLVQVIAQDDFLVADPSDVAEFTTFLPNPESLRVTATFEDGVSLQWAAPSSAATITGYRLEWRTVLDAGKLCETFASGTCAGNPKSNWQEVGAVDATSHDYTVSGLFPCTFADAMLVVDSLNASDDGSYDPLTCGSDSVLRAQYGISISTEYRVVTVNDFAESTGTAPLTATPAYEVPGEVSGTQVQLISPGTAHLTWTGGRAGSSQTAGFTIFYSTDPNDLECEHNDFGGCEFSGSSVEVEGTAATIDGLDFGSTYSFVVVARMNSSVFGLVQGASRDVLTLDIPEPVDSPSNVVIDESTMGFTTAQVSWDASTTGSGEIGYQLQTSIDAGLTWVDAGFTTNTDFVLTKLRDGQTYSLRVIATDDFGASDPSDVIDFQTKSRALPDVPIVQDWRLDRDIGTVTFDAGSSHGATHVRYEARISADLPGGSNYPWTTCDTASFTCQFTSITPGTPYRVMMRAFADGGHVQSSWTRYAIPDLEIHTSTGAIATRGSQVLVAVSQLRPGASATISFGGKAQTVIGDDAGEASALFTARGSGRKVVSAKQNQRIATTETWVIALTVPNRIKPGKINTFTISGVQAGLAVTYNTSVANKSVLVARNGKAAFTFRPSAPAAFSYSILVDGREFFADTIAAE